MPTVTLTYQELLDHLNTQINFLITSCNAFDQGNFYEATRLATTLRVLLHDTSNSQSLLHQLGAKTVFYDSDYHHNNSPNQTPIPAQTSELSLISSLQGNTIHHYKPNFSNNDNQAKIDFDVWWNQTVIKDMNAVEFSRKKIILSVANRDGGAHIDPTLDEDYYKLTRLNSTQHFFSDNIDVSQGLPQTIQLSDLKPVPSPLPLFYTIRQIAHEVLISKIDASKSQHPTLYPFDENNYQGISSTFLGFY